MQDGQHLKKLSISGFRGLSSLDLDELGTFNILLGANDVGKTSILEAIFLLAGPANLQLPVVVQNWRHFIVQEFDGLSPLFHRLDVDERVTLVAQSQDSTVRTLVLSAPYTEVVPEAASQGVRSNANGDRGSMQGGGGGGDQSSSALHGSRALQYDVTIQKGSRGEPISFSGQLSMRGREVDPSIKPDRATEAMISARFIAAGYGYESSVISNVMVQKKTDELLDYLRIVNPRVEGAAINGTVAYLDIGLKTMMPLNMFGSGMMRAATILSPCILGSERILLIDELENGLHYRAIPPLLKVLLKLSNERQVQVFATTHRLEVLKGLQQVLSQELSESQRTTKCFALQRDKLGTVRSYKYDYDQFDHCIAQGIEFR